jgi:hypothetical protein
LSESWISIYSARAPALGCHETTRRAVDYGTHNVEEDMGQLATFGQFLGGLGILFIGVGFLWFVSVYSEKKK